MGTDFHSIIVQYDGEWLKVDNEWEYDPRSTSGIDVAIGSTFAELVNKLYRVMEVDKEQYDIVVKVKYKLTSKWNVPAILKNDEDFNFFIRRNAMQPLDDPLPMCISLVSQPRVDTSPVHLSENEFTEPPLHDDVQLFASQCPTSSPPTNLVASSCKKNSAQVFTKFASFQGFENETSDPILYLHPPPPPPREKPFEKGVLFDNKKIIKDKATKYALSMKFRFTTLKSCKKLLELKCSHGNCTWRLRAVKLEHSDMFEIRTYVQEHTCKLLERKGISKQATASALGNIFKEKYMAPDSDYRPKEIVRDVHKKFGIKINYQQGWRTRECAMEMARGTIEESFDKLPSYLYMLEKKNRGTVADIKTDADGRFRYMFMALGVSIRGFIKCTRPVLCVDGSFLKHKVGGQMLIAVALDANEKLYPIAMGVVDTESNESWNYFMEKLRLAIGLVPNLVFVSDRHKGIANALSNHFPEAHHGVCTFHLKLNINKRFKTNRCHFDLVKASEAYKISDFHRHFDNIRSKNPRVAQFLENEVQFERWSRAFFPSIRYNVLTSNYAESFNNRSRHARKYPITSLVEFVRSLLQEWFVDRKQKAATNDGRLAPKFEEKIVQDFDEGMHFLVSQLNDSEYMVHDGEQSCQVDLSRRTCYCREFELNGIPCKHALAVCHLRKFDPYEFCSEFYTNEAWVLAYEETIYPVLIGNDWDHEVPDEIMQRKCIIPLVKPKKGRRTEKRKPSSGEFPKVRKRCSSCGYYGHNRSTCCDHTPAPSATTIKKKKKNGEPSFSQPQPSSPQTSHANLHSY